MSKMIARLYLETNVTWNCTCHLRIYIKTKTRLTAGQKRLRLDALLTVYCYKYQRTLFV